MISKKDGFLFFNSNEKGKYPLGLIIDGNNLLNTIKYINNNNIESIIINSAYARIPKSLSFLEEISHNIESVNIIENDIDLHNVNCLNNLKQLALGEIRQTIDLNNFKNLEVLFAHYSVKLKNLHNAVNLKSASLYNFKDENLMQFNKMENLESIWLHNTTITDFNGLSNLTHLKTIEIDKANDLVSLKGIGKRNISLSKINIYNAKKLVDLNPIMEVQKLKTLFLQKIHAQPNLNFLSGQSLNTLVIGTKIEKIDSDIILGIKEILIPGYQHNTLK